MSEALQADSAASSHVVLEDVAQIVTLGPMRERLSLMAKLLYGLPNLAAGAMAIPLLINMPKFYADVIAVPMAYLAVAIAATRCLDAIIDPSIGLISDRTRSRWGRRRPYIFIGAPLGGLAFWALMSPPVTVSGIDGVVWFVAASMICSLFLTIALLPHYALGAELSLDYNERNGLFGAREAFGVLGTIVAAAAPGLLMHHFGWNQREVFAWLGLAFTVALVVLCWLMVAFVHERPEFRVGAANPLVPGIRRALRNRPFRVLLATYVAQTTGGGMGPIMLPFFIAYVIQPAQPTLWLSIILLAYLGLSFLCIPVGVAAARRFGKLPTLVACYVAAIFIYVPIYLFVGKGDTGLFLVLVSVGAVPFGASLFLPPSMQAEVIDYDELYTGKRREAQYAGFWSFLPKVAAIPGAALPIALLAWLGYVPNANQSAEVTSAIRALYSLGPLLATIVSLVIVWRFPINAENHAAIRLGIARHKRGENAIDPLTGAEVPPPNTREVDEGSGWFLDNFSVGELKRFLAQDRHAPIRDVWRAAGISLVVCVISGYEVVRRMGAAGSDPGAIASLAVITSGFALAVFLFHLLRLRPAQALAAGSIPDNIVRDHLMDCRLGRM